MVNINLLLCNVIATKHRISMTVIVKEESLHL